MTLDGLLLREEQANYMLSIQCGYVQSFQKVEAAKVWAKAPSPSYTDVWNILFYFIFSNING